MFSLSNIDLENLINDRIIRRDIIDDTKGERVIEKVSLTNKKVLIKYGRDAGILNEVKVYENIICAEKDPVPKLLISKKLDNDTRLMVLEWIEGVHPDFSDSNDINLVFSSLGKWAGAWSYRIDNLQKEYEETLPNFKVLHSTLQEYEKTENNCIGKEIINLLNKCLNYSEEVLEVINKSPLTLDPGDISLHNFIIDSSEKVFFIDFESTKVKPMIMLLEHLGEDYESIPHTLTNIRLAMQTFLNDWNKAAKESIGWEEFEYCQLCARVYYKIGKYNYWIKRILQGKNVQETMGWIKNDEHQMQELLEVLDKRYLHY
ncbi:hypothetical protein [Pseudogracilibacillus auburnensis]|uniref:hypothetical protein n=1 Tax=Pseudogracilibacillus auburnensis TaxID=1494959 RepID=UPI001A95A15C|nr:hypothetical protein [Pseudogracilibacillus auburnensis]MBO1003997.1 hypothetical protein [Pseudogracilibacillus auburnensis]